MMKLIVEVLSEDIYDGKREDCDSCPIALAMNRAFDDADLDMVARVYDRSFTIRRRGTGRGTAEQKLPPGAAEFVREFDEKIEVEPYTFEVDVVLPA